MRLQRIQDDYIQGNEGKEDCHACDANVEDAQEAQGVGVCAGQDQQLKQVMYKVIYEIGATERYLIREDKLNCCIQESSYTSCHQ